MLIFVIFVDMQGNGEGKEGWGAEDGEGRGGWGDVVGRKEGPLPPVWAREGGGGRGAKKPKI